MLRRGGEVGFGIGVGGGVGIFAATFTLPASPPAVTTDLATQAGAS